MVLQPPMSQLSVEDCNVISPGDLVNCRATIDELRRVPGSAAATAALIMLDDVVEAVTKRHMVAFIIAVVGSHVHVCVLSTKRVVVIVPRRWIILFKGGMSDRERDVRAALSEEEP